MRSFVLIGTVAGLLAAAFGASAADDPLAETLARIDRAAAGFKGLTADMKKISHTAVLNEDSTDIGTIALKRGPKPNDLRVLFDIKQPDAKQIGFGDNKCEIYAPKINTVQIYDLGKNKGLVDQFLLLGFGSNSSELKRGYNIKLGGPEEIEGQKTVRIELNPKSKEVLSYFTRVDLWISDATGLAIQQKVFEPGGDYILATYSNMKLEPNLPDSAVRLRIPKDAKKEYPQK